MLNESSVWSGSREDADRPDAHQALPEIRRLLLEGKNVEAERLVNANFTCQGQGSGHGTRRQRAVRLLPDARQPAAEVRRRRERAGAAVRQRTSRLVGQSGDRVLDGRQPGHEVVHHPRRPARGLATRRRPGQRATDREYRLTSAEDVPARDPRTWKLEGSTDGKTWTLLDEHKDEPVFAKRHETRSYRSPSRRRAGSSASRSCRIRASRISRWPRSRSMASRRTALAQVPAEEYSRTLDLRSALATVVLRGRRSALHARAFRQRARRSVRLASDRRQAGRRCRSP